MNVIIYYAFNSLKINQLLAEVFIDNEIAISLYKKFNFKKIDRKKIDDKEVILMELKNENR